MVLSYNRPTGPLLKWFKGKEGTYIEMYGKQFWAMGRLNLLGGQSNLLGGQMPTQLIPRELTCYLLPWLTLIKTYSQQTHNIFITFFKGRMNSLQKHFLVMFVKHYQNVLKCL